MVELKQDIRGLIKDNIETVFLVIAGESMFESNDRKKSYDEWKLVVVDELAKADEKYKNINEADLLMEGMKRVAEAEVKMEMMERKKNDR